MTYNGYFNGKVVLVTGSSSKIGASTVITFSRAGAQVVVMGLDVEDVSKVAQKCNQLSPKGLEALQSVGDLTKTDYCKGLIDLTVDKLNRIDIMVNNAGIFNGFDSFYDIDILNIYDHIMNLTVRSVVYLTHLAVNHLVKSNVVIINISSAAGLRPYQGMSIYGTSKSALDMFTKCLALELGNEGVRVNSIKLKQF